MSCITTTHSLAREWLSKPDGFLTATFRSKNGDKECVVGDYERASTNNNSDEACLYWTLNIDECD